MARLVLAFGNGQEVWEHEWSREESIYRSFIRSHGRGPALEETCEKWTDANREIYIGLGEIPGRARKLDREIMIDAVRCSNSYNAFWRENAAAMEYFVRRLNLAEAERFAKPVVQKGSGNNAFIAELAFSIFEGERSATQKGGRRQLSEVRTKAMEEASRRLAVYAGRGFRGALDEEEVEWDEVEAIAGNLRVFFQRFIKVVLRPRFRGCGFIDESEGDVIAESTVFEVKTVERGFRSADLKQLLVYSALDRVAGQFGVSEIGLVNPRRGTFWRGELDYVCRGVAGRSAGEVLEALAYAVTSGGISR